MTHSETKEQLRLMKDETAGFYAHYHYRLEAVEAGRASRTELLGADELIRRINETVTAFSAASQAYEQLDIAQSVAALPEP